MKKKLLFIPIIVLLMAIIHSCDSDSHDNGLAKKNDRAEVLNEARLWYEDNKPVEMPSLRSIGEEREKIHISPNWQQAFRRQNKEFKVVEAAFIWEKRIAYATRDAYEAYEETDDTRYLYSKSRLVIRTNRETNERVAFIMTLIPSRQYWEAKDFQPFKNITYLDVKDFSGRLAFHSLEGDFMEGVVLLEGQIVGEFQIKEISSGFKLRCWEERYTGTYCNDEPIYEIRNECRDNEDEEFDSSKSSCQNYEVQIGVEEVCYEETETIWNINCRYYPKIYPDGHYPDRYYP